MAWLLWILQPLRLAFAVMGVFVAFQFGGLAWAVWRGLAEAWGRRGGGTRP